MKNDDKKKMLKDYGFYVDLVLRFGITIIIFVFIGFKLDEFLNIKPVFLIFFTFFGAAGAFYSLYKSLIKYEKKEKTDE